MNVAYDLLNDLAVIGATLRPAGDRLILRAGRTAIPAELVHRVREAKVDLIATLAGDEAHGAFVKWLNESASFCAAASSEFGTARSTSRRGKHERQD